MDISNSYQGGLFTIMLPLRAPGGTGMLDWTPKPKTKIATTVLEALPEPPVAALPVPRGVQNLLEDYED